jgi:hypothetical protein
MNPMRADDRVPIHFLAGLSIAPHSIRSISLHALMHNHVRGAPHKRRSFDGCY